MFVGYLFCMSSSRANSSTTVLLETKGAEGWREDERRRANPGEVDGGNVSKMDGKNEMEGGERRRQKGKNMATGRKANSFFISVSVLISLFPVPSLSASALSLPSSSLSLSLSGSLPPPLARSHSSSLCPHSLSSPLLSLFLTPVVPLSFPLLLSLSSSLPLPPAPPIFPQRWHAFSGCSWLSPEHLLP